MEDKILNLLTQQEIDLLNSPDGLVLSPEERTFRSVNRLNDALFKYLFARESSKPCLISFLNSILDDSRQIVDLNYIDRELSPSNGLKAARFDMRATDVAGRTFHVEVQTGFESRFFERCTFYAALSYTEEAGKGEPYTVLCPVILVALTNFVCFRDNVDVYSWFRQTNVKTGKPAPDTMEFHLFELPKLKNSENKLAKKLDRWLRYLSSTKGSEAPEIVELVKEDPIMERTLQLEREFFMDASERYRYLRCEADKKLDLANLINIKAEGKAEGKHEMAKKLLALGVAPELIVKASGLSLINIETPEAKESNLSN